LKGPRGRAILASVRLALALLTLSLLSGASARGDSGADPLAGIGTQVGVPAADRVLGIGEKFLGVPYLASPFGEGPLGQYDRNPLSRFDGFDCTTFVETVTALALSDSKGDFQSTLNHLRYKDGNVEFTSRNHITSLDWIPNNIRAGFYRDVTESVAPGRTAMARALIDKRAWYEKMTSSRIQIPGLSDADKQKLLVELHGEGLRYSAQEATVPYIPLTALFAPGGSDIFSRIPSGSVINIVRPNWDLVKAIGTHLNVSHQGFAVRKNGVLYYLEASEVYGKVSMVPLADYLRQYLESKTIKGINVLSIAR
jgi:hypothetical protein